MRPLVRLYPIDIERLPSISLGAGLGGRLLTTDEESEAFTRVLLGEAGARIEPPPVDAAEQIYILGGAFELEGARYEAGSYLRFPAGARREPVRAVPFDGPCAALQIREPAAARPGEDPVTLTAQQIDAIAPAPAAAGGVGGVERVLYEDASGSLTRILDAEPYADTGVLVHDFSEEGIIIAGSYKMTWRLGEELHPTGTYTHIPPGVEHGPIINNEPYRCFEVRRRRACS